MAEHEGEQADEQEDPFADLVPERRMSEQTIKILALATFIASAKDRGNSWANIRARLLEKKNISISTDHLRMTMERYANYKPKRQKRNKPNTKHATKPNNTGPIKSNNSNPGKTNAGIAAEVNRRAAALSSSEQHDEEPPVDPVKPAPFGAKGFEL